VHQHNGKSVLFHSRLGAIFRPAMLRQLFVRGMIVKPWRLEALK